MRCYGEKPASFLRLQPSGNIPVAIIDGIVYSQSNDIMFALETLFPNHKRLIKNESDSDRSRTQALLKLERKLFSFWMYWLTGSDAKGGKKAFIDVLTEVEMELNLVRDGDFFMGENVSIVDFMFAPFLERICASLLYYKGFQIRMPPGRGSEFPSINKWFDAMETLESYRVTKSDFYTHNWDLPPQLGGCVQEDFGLPFALAVNGDKLIGEDRASWAFPLVEHNGGIEPDWKWCADESIASREAVERLSFNHENIVRFAARGAGQQGFPAFSAPLSDPKAKPNESIIPSVDGMLRLVSLALLDGVESWESQTDDLSRLVVNNDSSSDVIKSLEYLRDRVGVPRDMRLPAARRLRATLNWAIERILINK
jgi:glutathione S-transferase